MYYYEKDYIMRQIHGISRMLAKMLFNKEVSDDHEILTLMEESTREASDYLFRLIDEGRINEAENRLFEILRDTSWERHQLAAMVLAFYDRVNSKDDEFLLKAGFSRDEIPEGLEDAMGEIGMEVPEYLKI